MQPDACVIDLVGSCAFAMFLAVRLNQPRRQISHSYGVALMTNRITRRTALGAVGALGLGASAGPLPPVDAKDEATDQGSATFVGAWTYRSFLSNPDIKVDFNQLEFA